MNRHTDVLIIGGGFGGVSVAQTLAKKGIEITLIDKKEYFEVTFATLRNTVSPQKLGYSPRKRYRDFIQGNFIQTDVESMNDKKATLTNGETIGFNRAIIATGSRYPSLPLAKSRNALSLTERHLEIHNEHERLNAAKSVLILGGGTVGIELAGEIASAFPEKNITLAHSANALLAGSKPKAQQKALAQLTAQGVEVKFNRKFIKAGDVYRCKSSQETLRTDLAYECLGMIPNTEFLKSQLPNILDTNGLIKVDAHMKVIGYETLYALGDCADLDENKHGYLAGVQGSMLAKSLLKSANGKKVKPYKTPPFAIITSTGHDSGVAQMPFGVTTARFFVNLKQKDMGITNMLKMYQTVPDTMI